MIGFGVGQIMRHVCKERPPWLHAMHKFEGLFQGSVAGVRRLAQSVENHHVEVFEQRKAAFRDVAHVGQVSSIPEPKPATSILPCVRGTRWKTASSTSTDGPSRCISTRARVG